MLLYTVQKRKKAQLSSDSKCSPDWNWTQIIWQYHIVSLNLIKFTFWHDNSSSSLTSRHTFGNNDK